MGNVSDTGTAATFNTCEQIDSTSANPATCQAQIRDFIDYTPCLIRQCSRPFVKPTASLCDLHQELYDSKIDVAVYMPAAQPPTGIRRRTPDEIWAILGLYLKGAKNRLVQCQSAHEEAKRQVTQSASSAGELSQLQQEIQTLREQRSEESKLVQTRQKELEQAAHERDHAQEQLETLQENVMILLGSEYRHFLPELLSES